MQFATRTNYGQVDDHFDNLEQAISYFLSEDGYRLDFIFPDGRTLYVHRGEYNDDIPEERINHPAWTNYLLANAGIMYYNPGKNIESSKTTNVISVKFGSNNNDTDA